jgi:hypothetical protein
MFEAAMAYISQMYPTYRWSQIFYRQSVVVGGNSVVQISHASEGAKMFFLQTVQWDWTGALVPSTQVTFTANGNPLLLQSNISGFNIVQSTPIVLENTAQLNVIANTNSAFFNMTVGYQFLTAPNTTKKAA